jgi:hypothetical protein
MPTLVVTLWPPQEHYAARRIDKDQFKSGAKHLTAEVLRRKPASTADIENHAQGLVKCFITDIDPLYGMDKSQS